MDAATAKLTSALEAVAHTANLNRTALEFFARGGEATFFQSSQRVEYVADLAEILAALDTWREAGNLFLASNFAPPPPMPTRQRCGNLCDCPSPLHHEMSELSSKLKHAPVAISRTDIVNELDAALARSVEAD